MRNSLEVLHHRPIYWKGKKLLVTINENCLFIEGCEASAREILLRKHSLFLPFHCIGAKDYAPRIDAIAHFEPNLEVPGLERFDYFGNAVIGKRRGFHFFVQDGIFHRPHLIPMLCRNMLKRGILFVHAILPDSSPYIECFGLSKTYEIISVVAPVEMRLHFFGVET